MEWRPFEHQGEKYCLAHLNPFDWHYHAAKGGKRPARTYKFHVTFSMHCFTRRPKEDEFVDDCLWYTGPKEKRVFCFERYELSRQLPDIIRSLGDQSCYHTNHGHFFTIRYPSKNGEWVNYEVYFDVMRATQHGWLNLHVYSAYVRTEDYIASRPKKRKIRLDVIAYKRQMKKDIRPGQ